MKVFNLPFFIFLATFLSGCVTISNPELELDVQTSVSIISDQGGGGSGVVLFSNPSGSVILSNRHVCEGVAPGAVVTTRSGVTARAVSMKLSESHDLCLLKVNRNLKLSSKIANSESEKGEPALVVGHPNLFPQINAPGQFSGFMDITMVVGMRKCTEKEFKKFPLECAFFGGVPILKTFETQAISSIIAPGNSGSPVFNKKGEVANLVFAGVGRGLSHGITVPNGQIRAFVFKEAKKMKWTPIDEIADQGAQGVMIPKIVKIQKTR